MIHRNISKKEVEQAILSPIKEIQQTPTRCRAIYAITNNTKPMLMIVVYDIQHVGAKEIVTAFVTSKINKYL